jgi:exonuclease VII large subunit
VRIRKFVFASICLAAIAASPAQAAETAKPDASAAEVRKEINEAMDAIARYSVTKRDEAVERANRALSKLDVELERRQQELRQRWNKMSESARAEARNTSDELERRRRELAEWYGGMKHGAQNAWEEIKSGFSRAYGELKKAWQRSEDEMGDTDKS